MNKIDKVSVLVAEEIAETDKSNKHKPDFGGSGQPE